MHWLVYGSVASLGCATNNDNAKELLSMQHGISRYIGISFEDRMKMYIFAYVASRLNKAAQRHTEHQHFIDSMVRTLNFSKCQCKWFVGRFL